ncbi:MAG: class I SAM-dependent methyltransferase, partial [Microthrixaceae bacterium]|nr:class I SAM-dependent methyltransferase [Microthrixaceae bacterium]
MGGKGITLTDEMTEYLVAHSDPPRSDVHDRLIAATAEAMGDLSIMQVAPEQGPWLTFMARLLGAGRAVEVGTFTGYSALCIAEGLGSAGRLSCFDISAEFVDVGRPFWAEAGVADRIDVTIGPAADGLAQLPADDQIDLAFIDADKTGYADYYGELLPRMRVGGLIVADNTLWSGRVIDDTVDDPDTVAIRAYNDMVVADDRV